MLDSLVHPCTGCLNRSQILPHMDNRPQFRRIRPASTCDKGHWQVPVFTGDPLPTWCPGKEPK